MKHDVTMQLIDLLPRDHFRTSEEIAAICGVSGRTVRNRLKSLNTLLREHGGRIESKANAGFKMVIDDEQSFLAFLGKVDNHYNILPNSQEERVQYLLDYLLTSDDYITLNDLSSQLYVSKSCLSCDLKIVKCRLKKYNVELKTKAKYGIKVSGSEFDLRLCMANNISNDLFERTDRGNFGSIGKELDQISKVLNEIFAKEDFKVTGIAYQNLIIHIYIALNRLKRETIILETGGLHAVKSDHPYEYEVAERTALRLSEVFQLAIPEVEAAYIAIHLAGKKNLSSDHKKSGDIAITDEIHQIVERMLGIIYDLFKIDFRSDMELRTSLALHLVPFKVRIYYDMNFKNPLLEEIKLKFTLAYSIAVEACSILENQFQKEIGEDEISYVALHFALALERRKQQDELKNVLLVSSGGQGTVELLMYYLKTEFGRYLNKLENSDLHKLEYVDFKQLDYVISTVPIPFALPIPVLEIKHFLTDDDIRAVKNLLHK